MFNLGCPFLWRTNLPLGGRRLDTPVWWSLIHTRRLIMLISSLLSDHTPYLSEKDHQFAPSPITHFSLQQIGLPQPRPNGKTGDFPPGPTLENDSRFQSMVTSKIFFRRLWCSNRGSFVKVPEPDSVPLSYTLCVQGPVFW